MAKLKYFIVIFLQFIITINFLNAQCIIRIEDGSPLVAQNFGSKKILLPRDTKEVLLNNEETANVYCHSELSVRTNSVYDDPDHSNTSLTLKCRENTFHFDNLPDYDDSEIFVSCKDYANSLYESNRKMKNCNNYTSYAIGTVLATTNQIVTAAICYDLDNLIVKYVVYKAYQAPIGFMSSENKNTNNDNTVDLDLKIDGFNTYFKFMSENAFNLAYNSVKLSNSILQLADFEFKSLVQDSRLQPELKAYENMLNIIWWRNLRLGNWLYYLQALEKRTKDMKYTVYTGTSGELTIPTMTQGNRELFTIEATDITLKAPEYIWAYLKPIDEQIVNEELVLVGYNSPFYTTENGTNFCQSICHEISWIADHIFGKTHSMPTFGLMYCCRVKDVADKLDNFPTDAPKITTTTTTPDIDTTEASTNKDDGALLLLLLLGAAMAAG